MESTVAALEGKLSARQDSLESLRKEEATRVKELQQLQEVSAHAEEDARTLRRQAETGNAEREALRAALEEAEARASTAEEALAGQVEPEPESVPAPAPEEAQVYLRMDDGSIYGPVGFTELYDWACDCRVAPTHALSVDKEDWVPAAEVADLGMEWEVTLINVAPYGPINMFAINTLIQDEAAAPDAAVRNVNSGEVLTADKLLAPHVMEMRERHLGLTQRIEALLNPA